MKSLRALINKSNIKNANSSFNRMLAICPYYEDEDKCESMKLQKLSDTSGYNWYLITIKDLKKIEFKESETCVISYGYTTDEIINYIETHDTNELYRYGKYEYDIRNSQSF